RLVPRRALRSALGGTCPADSQERVRIEARAAHEGAVDIGLAPEVGRVRGLDAPPVKDEHLVAPGGIAPESREPLPELFADVGMDFLGLVRARRSSSANRPDGLVRDDNTREVVRTLDPRKSSGELVSDDRRRAAVLPLVERLADAEDRHQAAMNRGFDLQPDEVARLAEDLAAF